MDGGRHCLEHTPLCGFEEGVRVFHEPWQLSSGLARYSCDAWLDSFGRHRALYPSCLLSLRPLCLPTSKCQSAHMPHTVLRARRTLCHVPIPALTLVARCAAAHPSLACRPCACPSTDSVPGTLGGGRCCLFALCFARPPVFSLALTCSAHCTFACSPKCTCMLTSLPRDRKSVV